MKDDAEVIITEEMQKMIDNVPIEAATAIEPQVSQAVSSPFMDRESFQDLYDIAKMFASSDMVPQNYQNKPMNCVVAIDLANRMNISPLAIMQSLYIVKGKPEWSGSACMSMIKASKEYTDVKPVYTGEPNTDSWACHIEAKNVKTGETVRGAQVSVKMAKAEGWYGKPGSKWQTMPELMLSYRAAAFFARVYVPNALMGFQVEGEVEDTVKTELPPTTEPKNFNAEGKKK